MLVWLLILFPVVSLVELGLLIWVGGWLGFWPTIGMVIATGIIGASLARREGLRCWISAQRKISRGELPTDSLFDGLFILLAGALLITPGLLTDLTGFALLVPKVRQWSRGFLARRIRARLYSVGSAGAPGEPQHDEIIDVRIIDAPPEQDDEP